MLTPRTASCEIVDEESADALLQLNVISIEDRPFTYTTAEQTEQYRFTVLVAAELVRVEDGEVLLALAELEGWGTYDAALAEEEGRDPADEAGVGHGARGIGGSDDGGVVVSPLAANPTAKSISVRFPSHYKDHCDNQA